MNKSIVLSALKDALSLISNEYQSLINIELQKQYDEVINKINDAILELGTNND